MNHAPTPPDVLDFYAILGLVQSSPQHRIESAYTTAKRKYHPQSRLINAEPDEDKFKQAGLAYDTLSNPRLRAKYDLGYHNVRALWEDYKKKLHDWKRQKEQEDKRRAALEALRQKRAADAARKKEAEAAAEARKKQDKEAQLKRDWERAEAETQRKKEMRERRLRKFSSNDNNTSHHEAELSRRERWKAAQERTREQAKVAEDANRRAAEERIRKQKEDEEAQQREATENQHPEQHQQNEQLNSPTADHSTTHEDDAQDTERARQERFAERQRAADQREQRVFEEARKRHAAAAEERLNGHQRSLKRPASLGKEEEEAEREVKRPRDDYSRRAKKTLAREWSHRKQAERLEEVGGKGNEHVLRDAIIDQGWQHIDTSNGEECDFRCKKSTAKLYGLWKCPDGGALLCKPCMNRLSTFGA